MPNVVEVKRGAFGIGPYMFPQNTRIPNVQEWKKEQEFNELLRKKAESDAALKEVANRIEESGSVIN
jgi:hypothetical protein